MQTRRELLFNMGKVAVVAAPLLASKSAVATEVRKAPVLHLVPKAPPVAAVSSIHHETPHGRSAADHLHKHHKCRHHHKKHTGAHNLRALHTLNTPGNRHDLALTMWGEARNYGEVGMRAIGHVVLNRVVWDHHATGHGLHGVCHKRKQFSCWYDHNHDRMIELPKLDDNNPDWKAFVLANQIAGKLLAGAYEDITGGATYYYAQALVTPYWLKDMTIVGVMFGHTFCKPAPHHPHLKKHPRRHYFHKNTLIENTSHHLV